MPRPFSAGPLDGDDCDVQLHRQDRPSESFTMNQATEVLAANQEFYRAFATPDLAAMDGLWAVDVPVTCVHPGWDALNSRDQVMESWRAILSGSPPPIRCQDEEVFVHGETAYVICHEVIDDNRLVAINMFVRREQRWLMVHHQASPMAVRAARRPANPAPPRRLH